MCWGVSVTVNMSDGLCIFRLKLGSCRAHSLLARRCFSTARAMAPKAKSKAGAKAVARLARASAKAKAKAKAMASARFNRANTRRQHRRRALTDLNSLADECGLFAAQVAVKTASPAAVERLVRLLEARCDGDKRQHLRALAKCWEDNGGEFSSPVVAEDDATPSPVALHRVLKPNFELKSRAFMLTYNSASFTAQTWGHFVCS